MVVVVVIVVVVVVEVEVEVEVVVVVVVVVVSGDGCDGCCKLQSCILPSVVYDDYHVGVKLGKRRVESFERFIMLHVCRRPLLETEVVQNALHTLMKPHPQWLGSKRVRHARHALIRVSAM